MIYTNKASSIFELIELIAATSGKKDKEALVQQLLGLPLGAKVVTYAYHPFKVYRMEAVPVRGAGLAPGANTLDESRWWDMLDDMEAGRLTGAAAIDAVQQAVNFLDAPSAELLSRCVSIFERRAFVHPLISGLLPVADRAENTAQLASIQRASS